MDGTVTPVSANERIATIDAIRGFALLGIFIMNLAAFHEPIFAGAVRTIHYENWWDTAGATLQNTVFAGKFNGIFSMLFAVGFTIQLSRLQERDPAHASTIYLRRVFWLLIFGLIHGFLFWPGDVLHLYAIFGLLLMFVLRRLPDKAVILLVLFCLSYPILSNVLLLNFADPRTTEHIEKTFVALNAAQDAANGRGSFIDAVQQNLQTMWMIYAGPWKWRIIPGFYTTLGVTMLIGLLIGRHRVFQNIERHLPTVRRLQYTSIVVGILCGAVFAIWRANVQNPMEPTLLKALASFCFAVSRVSVMAFYVTTIVRVMQNDSGRQLLNPIVQAGRMPLTNYLMQTAIGITVFSGWGLGYWDQTGPAFDLIFAFAVFFLIQAPLSTLWLRHFERGPMEHLWRTLTYWRPRNH